MTNTVTSEAPTGDALAPLTASDRCDRCSAAAQVRAVLPSGFELLFCGHHFSEHRSKLEAQGASITGEPATV
ncbi:DUF7455 domain-containing protein [Tsukamurella ocularis]|uniref:DUF7455 domain-containing protein n=1 Tax=Tsukamurella ocularis TaxID=1970234 RepID=UPI00216A0E73|nr:hypothetical protein [Tsukamurella ocularis]MCS3780087.1 hypothetical protein [Tsukamurella ocularis]MCS3786359.1 hypothetical protein [Tsukamurella ocularis]MCS3849723.1 hypothetical protein [Tsukamurella ocularis]